MASHNELGKQGEEMALVYLVEKGYKILHCNWRYSRFEIDIIASKDEKLHIIEVKTLHAPVAGYPEESVTKKKFRYLVNAADQFLHQHPEFRHVQFNILSITLNGNKKPEFFFIEDVFF
jgi:putative endonuclease